MPNHGMQCKFFVHGACLKGEHCEYSHDWKTQPNNICTFYQKGVCSYGSRCRYDHVKVSNQKKPVSSSSQSVQQEASRSLQTRPCVFSSDSGSTYPSTFSPILDASNGPCTPENQAWIGEFDVQNLFSDIGNRNIKEVDGSDRPICSFAAAGTCPYGDRCPHIHGDLCSTCGKYCLHPSRIDEREEHINLCQKNRKYLEALRTSQEIECSVCLDRVLSKPTAAERKFGLLSECDHPFCISCIRNWRNNSPDSGLDVNSALRACPICRKLSYFVIPSVIWYSSKEEKQEIIDKYKDKLRSIDCRYFNFGNGTCPFGTSCFYKHAYRDGRLEEVVLRHLGSEDGTIVIAKNIRLADFFRDLRL